MESMRATYSPLLKENPDEVGPAQEVLIVDFLVISDDVIAVFLTPERTLDWDYLERFSDCST